MKAAEKLERQGFLGASDFSAILGIDRFRKPIDVWEEKTGRREPRDDDEDADGPAEWGRWLERAIVERWSRRTGLAIVRTGGPRSRPKRIVYTHPEYPFIRATPDAVGPRVREGRAWRLPYIVEAKTSRAGADFGEPGTDEIPRYYKAQTIVQAACSGAPVVHVAVLIAGSSPRNYVVEPTKEQIEAVIGAGVEFWNDHVLADVEPEASEDYLRRKHPIDDGEDLVATDADIQIAERYRLAEQNEAQATAAKLEVRTKIIERLGTHSRLIGPGFRISYKRSKDSTETNWKNLAGDYRRILDRVAEEIAAELAAGGKSPLSDFPGLDLETLESIHTQTKPGSRRFTPKFDEEEER